MQKTALMFAGQGAQVVGMGKDLAQAHATAQALFERANAALGYDLRHLCFNGPEIELTQTQHAQPAIYLVGWIAFQLLRERLPTLEFHATAGLSLGEFTALAAAQAISFEEGLTLVRQRGLAMQEACEQTRGAMAAIVGLEETPTREVCAEAGVALANLNCPGQIVISGPAELIQRACDLALSRGARKALPLPVAGAYHSPLMAGAEARLADALAGLTLKAAVVPVISNVTAQPHGAPDRIAALLVQQVTSPVAWEASIRHLLAQGFTRFIELGPGKALSGFLRRIDRHVQVFNIADVPSLDATLEALGKPPASPAPAASEPQTQAR
jgi:[acyl-carrier-protein] S-malonyltransferase